MSKLIRAAAALILVFPLSLLAQATQTALPQSGPPLNLSLEEAINSAVERNLGVEIQSFNYRAAGYAARSAYGVFDWLAFADISAAHQEQPVSTTINAPASDRTVANIGLRQTIPTGGTYSIGFNNNKSDNNNPFNTVNPSYGSNLGFALDQPLLRNFGVNINRRNINVARNTLGISREAFRTALTNTVLAVEQAYFDLIFARQSLEVMNQSLFLARDQERITQIRIDVGASAPLDILQPRVAIATREELVITAEAQIRNAEDRLRQLMNLPMSEWDRPIVPTQPVVYTPMQVDLKASVAKAIELRPEVRQARLGTQNRRIDYTYTRNQRLPQLDLSLNYGFAGLGGNRLRDDQGNPIPVLPGGYSDAFEQVSGFDFPSWSFGVNIGVPVTNVGPRSAATRARLEMESARADEERTQQLVAMEVRQAARDIDTLARQIVATRTAREAAEKNLDAERKRFENGLTTNFNVLQIQQDLADARSREIATLVAYNKAVANYHRAVGDLLEARNITVEDPERFSIPRGSLEDVRWLNFEEKSEPRN
jgi:outer membrane protein